MTDLDKLKSLPAYGFRREGKKRLRALEIGIFKTDEHGNTHLFMDRTPLGGFTGYVLMPKDGKPPEPQPARPGDAGDDDSQG